MRPAYALSDALTSRLSCLRARTHSWIRDNFPFRLGLHGNWQRQDKLSWNLRQLAAFVAGRVDGPSVRVVDDPHLGALLQADTALVSRRRSRPQRCRFDHTSHAVDLCPAVPETRQMSPAAMCLHSLCLLAGAELLPGQPTPFPMSQAAPLTSYQRIYDRKAGYFKYL